LAHASPQSAGNASGRAGEPTAVDNRATSSGVAPDALAIRILLSQLANPPQQKPDLYIGQLRLGRSDESTLTAELARYRERELPLAERASRLGRDIASGVSENRQEAMTIDADRMTLVMDTHSRLLERLTEDGRRKWLGRLEEMKKRFGTPAGLSAEDVAILRSAGGPRRAASATVSGRLRRVTCSPALVLDVDSAAGRLRLVIEDPKAITVLGQSGGGAMLDCGELDVPIRIDYDPTTGRADGITGVVRVLDYRR
jgi:hypothetical protein